MRHDLFAALSLMALASTASLVAGHIADDPAGVGRRCERGNEVPRWLYAEREGLRREIERAEAEGRTDDARRPRGELAEAVRRSGEYLRELIRSGE